MSITKYCTTIAEQLLTDIAKNPNLLKHVRTGDETSVYGYVKKMARSYRTKKSTSSSVKCEIA